MGQINWNLKEFGHIYRETSKSDLDALQNLMEGQIGYTEDTKKWYKYDGSSWTELSSGSTGGVQNETDPVWLAEKGQYAKLTDLSNKQDDLEMDLINNPGRPETDKLEVVSAHILTSDDLSGGRHVPTLDKDLVDKEYSDDKVVIADRSSTTKELHSDHYNTNTRKDGTRKNPHRLNDVIDVEFDKTLNEPTRKLLHEFLKEIPEIVYEDSTGVAGVLVGDIKTFTIPMIANHLANNGDIIELQFPNTSVPVVDLDVLVGQSYDMGDLWGNSAFDGAIFSSKVVGNDLIITWDKTADPSIDFSSGNVLKVIKLDTNEIQHKHIADLHNLFNSDTVEGGMDELATDINQIKAQLTNFTGLHAEHIVEWGAGLTYTSEALALASLPKNEGEKAFVLDKDNNELTWHMYHNGAWVQLADNVGGNVDLSQYYTKTESDAKYETITGGASKYASKNDLSSGLSGKQDALSSGQLDVLSGDKFDSNNYFDRTESDNRYLQSSVITPFTGSKLGDTTSSHHSLGDYYRYTGIVTAFHKPGKYYWVDGNHGDHEITKEEYDAGGLIARTSLSDYQKKTDNTLNTTSKDIVGAINELNTDKQDKITGLTQTTGQFKLALPTDPTNTFRFVGIEADVDVSSNPGNQPQLIIRADTDTSGTFMFLHDDGIQISLDGGKYVLDLHKDGTLEWDDRDVFSNDYHTTKNLGELLKKLDALP